MKKVILTVIAVFALTFANAQSDEGMKFGVKAGYLSSNFTGDFDGGDARSSFYIGGLVDFAISEKFHVQPELLYSMEGNGEDEGNLDFIRIPVMGKFYVAEGFSLQAGTELAFVAGGGAVKDFTKSMDLGLGLGAGYELTSGLFFDARYNLGLANISDVDGVDGKTVSINIGLGYRF